MRKTILHRFLIIILISMIVSGVILFLTVSNAFRSNTRNDLTLTLQMLDGVINYDLPIQEQIEKISESTITQNGRITVIDHEGKVLADSSVGEFDNLDNHLEREEITDAIHTGSGYAVRTSQTQKERMLYVAIQSAESEYILRIAIPFSGALEYLELLLPAILISIGVAVIIAVIMAETTTGSIVRPLQQMAEAMDRTKDEAVELEFEEYQYRELNIIAKTIERMSNSLKKYIRDIEFEKLVRQEFFTNVSHELKTPITSIRGFTELLQNGFAKDEETQQEFMSRILKETDHMTHLINDILMISRLETKEIQEIRTEVRFSILLEDVLNTFRPMIEERRLVLSAECIPCVIYANAEQIKELLNNLISNAIKYNKKEGSITIRAYAEQKDLIIEVSDTGIGIPEGEKKRVFERFYRVDRARSKAVSGTGLGLSIVKHIVNYYQGSIKLETKVGKGSSFLIVLPNIIR